MPTMTEVPMRTSLDPDMCRKDIVEGIKGRELSDERLRADLVVLGRKAAWSQLSEGMPFDVTCTREDCPYAAQLTSEAEDKDDEDDVEVIKVTVENNTCLRENEKFD